MTKLNQTDIPHNTNELKLRIVYKWEEISHMLLKIDRAGDSLIDNLASRESTPIYEDVQKLKQEFKSLDFSFSYLCALVEIMNNRQASKSLEAK